MASSYVKKQLKEIKEKLEILKAEFEEKFDEHSEAWQESEAGEQCMANIESLSSAIESLEEVE